MSKSKKFVNRWSLQFRPIDEISMIAPSIKSLSEYTSPVLSKIDDEPDSMISYAVQQIGEKYGKGFVAYYLIQNDVVDAIGKIPGLSVYQYRVESGVKFTIKSSVTVNKADVEGKLLDGYGEDWVRLAKLEEF